MMRRILAAGVAAAMAAGLLVVDVGPLGAENSPRVNPVLIPPEGQTAVKSGDSVAFAGSAPAGSTKEEALIRTYDPSGDVVQEQDVTQYTRVNDGRIGWSTPSGKPYTLPELPSESDHIRYLVTVRLSGGGTETGISDPLPVDLVRPNIVRYEVVRGTRIRVVFSEPVFVDLDDPLDWRLETFPEDIVTEVTGTGAERFLHLNLEMASSLHEDSTPTVRYKQEIPLVKTYRDRAGSHLGQDNRPTAQAVDRVPPTRIPAIEEIGGQSAAVPIHSSDPAPEITVGNLRPGHVAEIYLETDGTSGRSAGDPLMGEATAGDDGMAQVALAEQLDPDGEHRLHAAARDPSGNRTNGRSATYVLDRVAPAPVHAAVTEAQTIQVAFSEAVLPEGGNPAEWTVSPAVPVTHVSGSGSERTLTLGAPLSPDAETTVSYVPADGYADRAGNGLGAFNIEAFNGIPPEVSVTVPLTKIWTSASSATIRGGTVGADRVELHQEQAAGATEAEPLATMNVGGDGGFQTTIGLPEDGAYELLVRGLRGTDPQVVGPFVDVPTIVRDTGAPSVQVLAPQDGALVAGGSTVEIQWAADDPSFGPGAIRIERSLDGGDTWGLVAGAEANDGLFEWTAPMVNTSAAKIRIRATDRAGNQGFSVSGPFTIDAEPPRFSATTLDQERVKVKFTEPVFGTTGPQDWRIAGVLPEDVLPADEADGDGIRALILHTTPAQEIGKNERPPVTYKPPAGVMRDRAGNRVPLDDPEGEFPALDEDVPLPRLTVVAGDGIVPQLFSVASSPSVLNRRTIRIKGAAEAEGNEVVIRRRYPRRATYAKTVDHHDETFAVTVWLIQNRPNSFYLEIRDPSGNTSETKRIVMREDSRRPRVRVTRPRGRRIRAGRRVWIRWRSRERYKSHVRIYYYSRRRGRFYRVTSRTRDDGRFLWRVPRHLRRDKFIILVRAYDRAGNRGQDFGRWHRGR